MKYKYVGNGAYLPGLPAVDLDDADLDLVQQGLLGLGVIQGMYTPDLPAKQAVKSSTKGQDAPTVPPAGQEGDKVVNIPPAPPTGS